MTLWFSDILDHASRTECAKGEDQIRAQSVKSKYLIVLCSAYTILHHPIIVRPGLFTKRTEF